MKYHRVDLQDCLLMATPKEKDKLSMIQDLDLLKELAEDWCEMNSYKLGGYLGDVRWDSTKI